nr:DUF2971 domain-containing protein [Sansalvadorimonas sp. 2012CJ34-2]
MIFDQLYFSDPVSFNDPLDCQPSVMTDSDLTELRAILKKQIQKRVHAENLLSLKSAKVTGNGADEHAERTANQTAQNKLNEIAYYATNPDYEMGIEEAEMQLLRNEIQVELLKQYDRGICCFSSEQDNPLLWSHYADQHRGICTGYSLERNPKPNLLKVEYGGDREVCTSLISKAVLDNDLESKEKLDENILLRKALPWGYENEWRLLGNRGLQDSDLSLEEITFGLRCPTSVKHAVVSALSERSKAINFYEIYLKHGSFSLSVEPLDIETILFLPRVAQSGIEIFGETND